MLLSCIGDFEISKNIEAGYYYFQM